MRSSPAPGAVATGRALADRVPSPALVLAGVVSTQAGAAVGKGLFPELGPAGAVSLRVLGAAGVLLAVARPRPGGRAPADLATAALFGAVLAAMNLAFYEAIARIPLGVAVTVEFVGPLGVAVAGSRRLRDGLWAALAAAGVVLLAEGGAGRLDPVGLLLALVAGSCWAAYILVSQRVGRAFPGTAGLALAMAVAAALLVPVGVAGAGRALLRPDLVATGAAVGLLSSALPYSLELEALRRLPTRVFGVLMSTEPAVAAVAGLVVLGEALRTRELLAIALVTLASAGAARSAGSAHPTPRPVPRRATGA